MRIHREVTSEEKIKECEDSERHPEEEIFSRNTINIKWGAMIL